MSEEELREKLRAAIAGSVQPGSRPKDILKKVRVQHPDAKSKDVALAAFSLMIEVADCDAAMAKALQAIGLSERGIRDSAD